MAWPVAALGLWALAELVSRGRRGELGDVRAGLRKAMPDPGRPPGSVAIVVAIALLPQIREFRDSVSEVAGTDSKLRYAVPVPEAFGVWPSGEFLFGNSDQGLTLWWLFAADRVRRPRVRGRVVDEARGTSRCRWRSPARS